MFTSTFGQKSIRFFAFLSAGEETEKHCR